ncbi:Oidioi.mRNA.OKI2018_I69.XSR.g13651.t1.cds [Oikopleura dioica]|uniref:Oidioi.mRNA.OKI2018_I69.XSR.g13651.t1.cds n=1 Tax=Oikopleura dioica TaxID=34765 RepID=A0ABN7S7H6_OIKDI|nr:Oidioi.mRNA.OKI2018_I69.XSR.g13651.t1.cds [Oikopleura dioica]
MDEGSADPVIGNCYEDDFLPPFQTDIDFDSIINDFDPAVFDQASSLSSIKYEIDSGHGCSPQSSPSSATSTISTNSPQPSITYNELACQTSDALVEYKPTPTQIVIKTASEVETRNCEKRRISIREKKPTPKKKARIEKCDSPKIVKIEKAPESVQIQEEDFTIDGEMSQAEINAVLEQNNWEANEKNIKKAKRKIKNKKSAQESRRRKKEHMTDLEEKAKHYESKSSRLERELEKERAQNKSLMSQVRELRNVVNQQFQGKNAKSATTQTSAAVMVVLLCMTIFKGTWSSSENNKNNKAKDNIISITDEFDYTPTSFKSRMLKCFSEDDLDFCMVDEDAYPTIDFDTDSDASDDELDPDLDFLSGKMDELNLAVPKEEKQWEYTPGALVKVVAQMFDDERENVTEQQPPEGVRMVS